MRNKTALRTLLASTAVLSAACASGPTQWQSAGLSADATPARGVCPVVVQNGTELMLEALVELDGVDRSLGLLGTGQSVTVGVSCSSRRLAARAVSQSVGLSEITRFRKSVLLDVTRETSLRFTGADRVRW